jgi:hypothetical protein
MIEILLDIRPPDDREPHLGENGNDLVGRLLIGWIRPRPGLGGSSIETGSVTSAASFKLAGNRSRT